jgi:hypothetical protein
MTPARLGARRAPPIGGTLDQTVGRGEARVNPSELMSRLARSLAAGDAAVPMPRRLCQACVDILDGQGGTLTVSAVPGERVVVSTEQVFADLESLQEVLGEGPVQQALDLDQVVISRVQDSPNPFPVFAEQASRAFDDSLTVYAVPMRVGTRTIGVLSLYVTGTDRTTRSIDDLQFLADAVGISLIGDMDALDWSQEARIHQATGMVAAQLRISPADALAVLRAHAFARETDLRAVADDVLARRMAFSHDDGPGGPDRTEQGGDA